MSWVTIIWSMVASACLTLAGVNLLVWCKKRTEWANLLFSSTAVAAAAMAFCELWMLRAETPGQFGTALCWLHVAAYVIILSLVGFVLFYMRAGRPWLAWTVCILRTVSLLLNFLTGQNLNYREVTGLRHIPFLGESVSVGEGVSNPWMLVGQLSLLLFVVFVADASLTVWRRGDRRQVVVTGGSIVFFVLAGTVQSVLVLWQIVQWPYAPSLCFMGIVAAMGYEVSREALRAAQLSEDLRESEARMALAAEAAGFGVWMWTIERGQVWGSERWLRLFGFAPEVTVTFESLLMRIHPDDRERVEHAVRQAVANRSDYAAEYRVVLPDNTQRWVVARGRVYPDTFGKPVRMMGATIDITARKQAEERFRLVVEAAPSGIALVNREGRIVLVNAQTEKLFGYSREELIGHAVEMLVPEGFRGAHAGHRAGFLAAPRSRAMGVGRELFALRKDGTEFPVEIGLSPIQTAEETLVLTAIVDITARKEAEAEALRNRMELAHVARVSTLGELAASVAHELNQPLGAILANAEAADLFLNQNPPALDELRAILIDIRQDDERASEVIRRMRALLRKQELDRQPLEINSVVEDVLQVISGDAALRKVAIGADLAPGLPKILGDRIHLQQVLLNLILNGMDALAGEPRERRRLSIRTRSGGEGLVELAVTDLGHGIEAEKLPRLFEPFYTTKPNGMGMGLSISRTIIQAHHGRIWAENNAAGGAVFRVALPVAVEGTKP